MVTVVVGGQFGSEGKGKVALWVAKERQAKAVVRVGGSNSGHTGVAPNGSRVVLRQLPTAALLPEVVCVLGPGSYVDPDVLLAELATTQLPAHRLMIDPKATLITPHDRSAELAGPLGPRIGSTCSGTGAAVQKRISRRTVDDLVGGHRALAPYLGDTGAFLRSLIADGEHIIVEGSQGFGLSLLHSPHFPHVTSRDTTAAGAIAEAGLSPFDVHDIVLVLRAHPIRVAGASGPFGSDEMSWQDIATEGGHSTHLEEFTSVTGRLRRVARFDPELVRQAIAVNRPSLIVLNHLDYLDAKATEARPGARATHFIRSAAAGIGQPIDYAGFGPSSLVECARVMG